MQRKKYVENNDDIESLRKYFEALGDIGPSAEAVKPLEAFSRITSEPIYAKVCDPVYNAAAMDGIAVSSRETAEAGEHRPLSLKAGRDFVYINTGGQLPKGFDSVIMIEDVIEISEDTVRITAPSYPWQNVRTVGESIAAGEMIAPSKHRLRPAEIGAAFASGNTEIRVYKKPAVGIIPTGSELTNDPAELSLGGRIMESNGKMLAALVEEAGGAPTLYPISRDEPSLLEEALRLAVLKNDMVFVNAGSSAGDRDYTVKIIEKLGRVIVHGIAVKPGKPTIFGIIDKKPVIGIPGYPVSAYTVFEMFAKKVLAKMAGLDEQPKDTVRACLTKRIPGSFKSAESVRVSVGLIGGRLVATPLERGASKLMTLVRADGFLKIDRLTEGIEAGEAVEISLAKLLKDIEKALVIIGSHDLIIDALSDRVRLSSAHAGSMAGLFSFFKNECHIAPIHLLDENGEYNISYIKKYGGGRKCALIKGVGREQGFMLPKGNPKGFRAPEDIARLKLGFANRQRGSGTRLLFDDLLKKTGIAPSEVSGYEKEYSNHLAVAAAVKNGIADVGLGALSAANALELDFVSAGYEEYDFLTAAEYLEDPRLKSFVEALSSPEFKKEIESFGGYDTKRTGEIIRL